MVMLLMTDQTTNSARSRLRMSVYADGAGWPHVGECAFAGIAPRTGGVVKQRNGGRVSAAGEAI